MNEQFLQYIWKFRLLNTTLKTTAGEDISVLHPGLQNSDGGPDFFNARIRIGPTIWAGNVEIHIRSSDWIRHSHHFDPAYDNVILHVVYEHDINLKRRKNIPLPTLELKGNFPEEIRLRYSEIMQNQSWIPCMNLLTSGSADAVRLWTPALAAERLSFKSAQVLQLLEEYTDWDEVFYILIASGFGFRVNSLPFELLAKSLPLRIIRKNIDNTTRLEALLFGQSGLLGIRQRGKYVRFLAGEYKHLQVKYNLKPLKSGLWKRLRLHPRNFPDIRISQFANWLVRCKAEPSGLLNISGVEGQTAFFHSSASDYFATHYRLGKASRHKFKSMGNESSRTLLINTLAPYLFAYGSARDLSPARMKALELLENLKPEDNRDLRMWRSLGLKADNALESQALLQLKRCYCDYKRCLECRIGLKILGKIIRV